MFRLIYGRFCYIISTVCTLVILGIWAADFQWYEDGAAALSELRAKYAVEEIKGQDMKIRLVQQKRMTTQQARMRAYAAVMGEDAAPGGRK